MTDTSSLPPELEAYIEPYYVDIFGTMPPIPRINPLRPQFPSADPNFLHTDPNFHPNFRWTKPLSRQFAMAGGAASVRIG